VPIGIIAGISAGYLYNRYSNIKLPSYLAFFAARRFVPIARRGGGARARVRLRPRLACGRGGAMDGLLARGHRPRARFGLFVYGVLNRLLIVTGLHHILNNVAWFIVGDFNARPGDLNASSPAIPARASS
jgi:PTS system N-acetylglucosamine-specific IIC component